MGVIPVGWLESSPIGKPVDGTRFLAFKVPLKDTLCRNMTARNRFSPAMLLQEAPKLSLIIDLTNTSRYYDTHEFTSNGIKHFKIFCPGKVVPTPKVVKQFFSAVDHFMKSENDKDKYIGVHCTHGINRTGYFICKYMIHRMGFKPDEAIQAFQTARGHDIVRDYLVNDLKSNTFTETKEMSRNHGNFGSRNDRTSYSRRPNDRHNTNYSRGSSSYNRPQYHSHNEEPINLRPDPFYRNVQNTDNPDTHSAESSNFPQRNNRRGQSNWDSNNTGSYNRQYNRFSESNSSFSRNTQSSSGYSQTSQLNYYDDDPQDTGNRYNRRDRRY